LRAEERVRIAEVADLRGGVRRRLRTVAGQQAGERYLSRPMGREA